MSRAAISNADLAILLLIAEQPDVNGYGLRRLVEERGYSAWAGVGSTSIYNRLKKLEERALIVGTRARYLGLHITAAARALTVVLVALPVPRLTDVLPPRVGCAIVALNGYGH